ncbi:MAG: 2-oxoacid:acceptor oxidoreductase family protein, partial [Candidatus Omnitrophota bacterium]|nr:2-oxoacid:acceptor oxidoreductase family protein [Candidatus Omnitrophota bacterium]
LHRERAKEDSVIIYDADSVKCDGVCSVKNAIGISVGKILKEEAAPEIMRNTCVIGAFSKTAGIEWNVVEGVLRKEISKDIELNIKVARRGYEEVKAINVIKPVNRMALPLITGSEAMGLGLLKAGLDTYIAYPMTPASPLLHFLAREAENFSIRVIHPESEIAVMLMALGFSYCGESVAVGTSGGGFCLMTEGLSFSGMAGLPVVVVLGSRPGPSTGLPTYTSQSELNFALSAGQGEFTRFVAAPSDAEDSYYWAAISLNISKKFKIPSILLTDKTICEGLFNFDIDSIREIKTEPLPISSSTPGKDVVVKVNSYEHDEYGITTEDPVKTVQMQNKRLLKTGLLERELEKYETVKCRGNNSDTAILCWGSNRPVCEEVGRSLGLKVVCPMVLSPFPEDAFKSALLGVKKIISVENNATGQLGSLIKGYGAKVDIEILKYDGRPFSVDELEDMVKDNRSVF